MIKINSNNEWDNLNDVIIGAGFDETLPSIDISFKLFFHDNIYNKKKELYEFGSHQINKQYIAEMNEDIEGLVSLLKSHNINVHRPKVPDKIEIIKTPNWQSTNHNCLNVRDMTIIIGNNIIESSPLGRYRYFETDYIKHILNDYYQNDSNAKWVQSPKPLMVDNSFDLSYVGDTIDKTNHPMDMGYEIMWDGAQCMRFNNDILFNGSSINHRLGAEWLQRYLGTDYKVHYVEWVDSHIDSTIVPIREGLLLMDEPDYIKIDQKLPSFLKDWEVVVMPETMHTTSYNTDDVMYASNAIDLNVLSINPKQLICHDTSQQVFQSKLKKYGIECIPCQLRHSQIFSGAFHCLSLDLNRS